MTVWVDPLRAGGWHLGPSCHLFADTPGELHAFAARLGMARSWFQGKPRLWHYDLTVTRRAHALRLGALELDARSAVIRAGKRLVPPNFD
jgi:hypothetical protein